MYRDGIDNSVSRILDHSVQRGDAELNGANR